MLAACLLLTAATVGVDFGWQPNDRGELEYIIQFDRDLVDPMVLGKALSSQIPEELEGKVRAFRIQIGTGELPRTIPASFNQPTREDEEADRRPRLLSVDTPILSTPPVPIEAAQREIQAAIDAANDQIAQYQPRSTRTLPQLSNQSTSGTQSTSNPSSNNQWSSQSQPSQPSTTGNFSIPASAEERYGSPGPSRFGDGQSSTIGSSTTSTGGQGSTATQGNTGTSGSGQSSQGQPSNFSSGTGTTGTGNFSSTGNQNNTGQSGQNNTGQQAPQLGQFDSGDRFATNTGSGNQNDGSSQNDSTGGSNRWGRANRGPQTEHQPIDNGGNNNSGGNYVTPSNPNQFPQNGGQQQQPQQQWNQGNQGNFNQYDPNFTQFPQQQNPQQGMPNNNQWNPQMGQFQPNYGQTGYPQQQTQQPTYVATLPQQLPPQSLPSQTPATAEPAKPAESPSDTSAAEKKEAPVQVVTQAPEWWFMVAIGFMMSLVFNFWSWKVSQEIRQKYDDLLEDVRDMRSLPEV